MSERPYTPPAQTPEPEREPAHAARYWQRTARLTLWLLLIWFAVTFSAIFFARQLAGFTLFGWPISFFMAAQGSILIYVTLIGMYAWCMRRYDRDYHACQEPRDDHEQQ